MSWPGLLCKTVTDLRLQRWVPELSPGNLGEASIFSFGAAVMSLFCPELTALEKLFSWSDLSYQKVLSLSSTTGLSVKFTFMVSVLSFFVL